MKGILWAKIGRRDVLTQILPGSVLYHIDSSIVVQEIFVDFEGDLKEFQNLKISIIFDYLNGSVRHYFLLNGFDLARDSVR